MNKLIETKATSVKKQEFKGKDGSDVVMYKVYITTEDGDVGCLNTRTEVKTGDTVFIGISVKDGFINCRIVEKPKNIDKL